MSPRVVKATVTVLVLCSLLFALAYWAGFIPRKAERKGREMAAQINRNLKQPGERVKVNELHPGDWTKVCARSSTSTGGAYSVNDLERQFQVMPPDTLRFPNGVPAASDWHWILLFFYPPNTVEMFAVPTDTMFGHVFAGSREDFHGPCRSHEEAILYRTATGKDPRPSVILLNEVQLQQIKELEKQ